MIVIDDVIYGLPLSVKISKSCIFYWKFLLRCLVPVLYYVIYWVGWWHLYLCDYDFDYLVLCFNSFSKLSHFSRTHQVRRKNPTEPKRKRRKRSTRKVLQIPAHLQNLLMKRYILIQIYASHLLISYKKTFCRKIFFQKGLLVNKKCKGHLNILWNTNGILIRLYWKCQRYKDLGLY